MKYVIFEDTLDATEVKIHKESCPYFLKHQENKSSTTIWHEGFKFQEAQNEAKSIVSRHKKDWKMAECCNDE